MGAAGLSSAAAVVKPLTDALGGSPSGGAAVQWTADRGAAFEKARVTLASTALLDHPAIDAAISLVMDALATHMGAVLQQRRLAAIGVLFSEADPYADSLQHV
jgi:hypothetical protein